MCLYTRPFTKFNVAFDVNVSQCLDCSDVMNTTNMFAGAISKYMPCLYDINAMVITLFPSTWQISSKLQYVYMGSKFAWSPRWLLWSSFLLIHHHSLASSNDDRMKGIHLNNYTAFLSKRTTVYAPLLLFICSAYMSCLSLIFSSDYCVDSAHKRHVM